MAPPCRSPAQPGAEGTRPRGGGGACLAIAARGAGGRGAEGRYGAGERFLRCPRPVREVGVGSSLARLSFLPPPRAWQPPRSLLRPCLPGAVSGRREPEPSSPQRGECVWGSLHGVRDVCQAPKSRGGSVTPWKRSFRPGVNHLAPHTFLRRPEVPPSRLPSPAPTLTSRGLRRGEQSGRGRPLPPLLSGEEPGALLALTGGADRAALRSGRGGGVVVVGGGSGMCCEGGGTRREGRGGPPAARGRDGCGEGGVGDWARGQWRPSRRAPARGGEERGGNLASRRESLPLPSLCPRAAVSAGPAWAAAEGTWPGPAARMRGAARAAERTMQLHVSLAARFKEKRAGSRVRRAASRRSLRLSHMVPASSALRISAARVE